MSTTSGETHSTPNSDDNMKRCPMCDQPVRPTELVCRHCGANLMLARREQPAVIARARARRSYLKVGLYVAGAISLLLIATGIVTAVRNPPTCGSNVPVIGTISCPKFTPPDNDSFFKDALAYERDSVTFHKRQLLCDSALAIAVAQGRGLRRNGYAACMARSAHVMTAHYAATEREYRHVAGYVSSTCQRDLAAWHPLRVRHMQLIRRLATFRINPATGSANINQLSAISRRESRVGTQEFAALKRVNRSC